MGGGEDPTQGGQDDEGGISKNEPDIIVVESDTDCTVIIPAQNNAAGKYVFYFFNQKKRTMRGGWEQCGRCPRNTLSILYGLRYFLTTMGLIYSISGARNFSNSWWKILEYTYL